MERGATVRVYIRSRDLFEIAQFPLAYVVMKIGQTVSEMLERISVIAKLLCFLSKALCGSNLIWFLHWVNYDYFQEHLSPRGRRRPIIHDTYYQKLCWRVVGNFASRPLAHFGCLPYMKLCSLHYPRLCVCSHPIGKESFITTTVMCLILTSQCTDGKIWQHF